MAFKMKGMNHGEGTGSAYKNVGYTKYGPESAAFQKVGDPPNRVLENELKDLREDLNKTDNPSVKKKIQSEINRIITKMGGQNTNPRGINVDEVD